MNHKTKIGALIVGLNGCVGNTTLVGHRLVTENELPTHGMISELEVFRKLPLTSLSNIVISGWDFDRKNAYDASLCHGIIPEHLFSQHKSYLSSVVPMKGVITDFDHKSLYDDDVIAHTLKDSIEKLLEDIDNFKSQNGLDKVVILYAASPYKDCPLNEKHQSLRQFEKAIESNDRSIPSGMIYCYAALKAKCAFIDFTPNPTLEAEALLELATINNIPIAGRDGNTGQTLLKSLLAEMLCIRNFRLVGWYSTNILGNNDGYILNQPHFGSTKIRDKTHLLPIILGYSDFEHKVRIDYYKPRGDNKESWDNIDLLGFLGLDMSFKINWKGRDSILACPLILDLIRIAILAMENKEKGLLDYTGIFFKNPLGNSERGFFQNWQRLLNHFNLKGA